MNEQTEVVEQQHNNDEKYIELISELTKNRGKLHSMLVKVEGFRNKLDSLFPNDKEFKSRYVLENKMKTVGLILGQELDILKQIDVSIKNEVELRRKVTGEDGTQDKREMIIDYAKALELLSGGQGSLKLNFGDVEDESDILPIGEIEADLEQEEQERMDEIKTLEGLSD